VDAPVTDNRFVSTNEVAGQDEPRVIRLRYAAVCTVCSVNLVPKSEAIWNKADRTATCVECEAPSAVTLSRGEAGASARRKYVKLREAREQRARDKLGRLSGLYLALSDEPQSTRAWGVGSVGEQRLGTFLNTLNDDQSTIILHDRRIPGTRANIDHIAVTPSGLYAIDAKNYSGKVQRIDKGGWFSSDLHLYVGRRNCTKLIAGMAQQLAAIRAVAEPLIEECGVNVVGVLCFVEAEWSLFAKPFQLGSVWVEWSTSLGKRLQSPGPLLPEQVQQLAGRLARALPPA
jgi:hypothetical protein